MAIDGLLAGLAGDVAAGLGADVGFLGADLGAGLGADLGAGFAGDLGAGFAGDLGVGGLAGDLGVGDVLGTGDLFTGGLGNDLSTLSGTGFAADTATPFTSAVPLDTTGLGNVGGITGFQLPGDVTGFDPLSGLGGDITTPVDTINADFNAASVGTPGADPGNFGFGGLGQQPIGDQIGGLGDLSGQANDAALGGFDSPANFAQRFDASFPNLPNGSVQPGVDSFADRFGALGDTTGSVQSANTFNLQDALGTGFDPATSPLDRLAGVQNSLNTADFTGGLNAANLTANNAVADLTGDFAPGTGIDTAAAGGGINVPSASAAPVADTVTPIAGQPASPAAAAASAANPAGAAAASPAAAAPAAAAAGGGGGLLGGNLGLTGVLGAGALAQLLAKQGGIPQQGNLDALAGTAQSTAAADRQLQKTLTDPLVTGNLPPDAQQAVNNALNDAIATTKARYAQLGLSGSTMEQDAINAVKNQTTALTFQIAQQMANTGLQAGQQGLNALGLQDQIFNQLMNAQIAQDTALQNAIAQFASAAALSTAIGTKKA